MNHSNPTDRPVLLPEVLDCETAAESVVLVLRIPERLAYFVGHFDQIAIVPGVVQIHWAIHYAKQYLGLVRVFSHMEVIKFRELLLAGQQVGLHLRYTDKVRRLEFVYRSETAEYGSGRIYFS